MSAWSIPEQPPRFVCFPMHKGAGLGCRGSMDPSKGATHPVMGYTGSRHHSKGIHEGIQTLARGYTGSRRLVGGSAVAGAVRGRRSELLCLFVPAGRVCCSAAKPAGVSRGSLYTWARRRRRVIALRP